MHMENAVPYTADIIKNRISTGIILVFHFPRNEKKQQITVIAEIKRCFSSKEKAGINDMAEKIETVLNNEMLRREMIAKGLEKVKGYSWKKCAEAR